MQQREAEFRDVNLKPILAASLRKKVTWSDEVAQSC
jgi:hypothetical protein